MTIVSVRVCNQGMAKFVLRQVVHALSSSFFGLSVHHDMLFTCFVEPLSSLSCLQFNVLAHFACATADCRFQTSHF